MGLHLESPCAFFMNNVGCEVRQAVSCRWSLGGRSWRFKLKISYLHNWRERREEFTIRPFVFQTKIRN